MNTSAIKARFLSYATVSDDAVRCCSGCLLPLAPQQGMYCGKRCRRAVRLAWARLP